jgi:hypothetical protein
MFQTEFSYTTYSKFPFNLTFIVCVSLLTHDTAGHALHWHTTIPLTLESLTSSPIVQVFELFITV